MLVVAGLLWWLGWVFVLVVECCIARCCVVCCLLICIHLCCCLLSLFVVGASCVVVYDVYVVGCCLWVTCRRWCFRWVV